MSKVITFLASSDSGGSPSLSCSDREAAHCARQASPAPSAYCPPGDWLAAEYALAAGCAIVAELETILASSWAQAWIGGGFLERLGDEFAASLAERRSATVLFEVLSCNTERDGTFTIVRDAGRGARDEVVVSGPVVLVLSTLVRRTGYVSRYRREQARKELVTPAAGRPISSEPPVPWQPARPRTRRPPKVLIESPLDDRMDAAFGISAAKESTAHQAIAADPYTCAQHLLRYLAHHELWQRAPRTLDHMSPPQSPVANPNPAHSASTTVPSSAQSGRRPRPVGKTPPAFRGPRPTTGPLAFP